MHNVNYRRHVPGFVEEQFLTIRPKNGIDFTISNSYQPEIVFDIKTAAQGQFIDPKRSFFGFTFSFVSVDGSSNREGLRFERSCGSIIRSYKIQSGFGMDIENVTDYNHLEALMCIMDKASTSPTPDGRGYIDTYYYDNVNLATLPNVKPDLGSLLFTSDDIEAESNNLATTYNDGIGGDFIHQLRSSVFGVYSTKYIPLSMMKGLRITMTLHYLAQCLHTVLANYGDTDWNITVRPVLHAYYISIPASIERQIGQKGKIPLPGLGFRTLTLPSKLLYSEGAQLYTLPITCKSLRAVFMICPQETESEGYDHSGADAAAYSPSLSRMATSYTSSHIINYQFFLDQRPVTDQPVNLKWNQRPTANAVCQIKLALGIDLSDPTCYSPLFQRPMMTDYGDFDYRQNYLDRNGFIGQFFPSIDMSSSQRSLELRFDVLSEDYDSNKSALIVYIYDQTLWVDYSTGESFLER